MPLKRRTGSIPVPAFFKEIRVIKFCVYFFALSYLYTRKCPAWGFSQAGLKRHEILDDVIKQRGRSLAY